MKLFLALPRRSQVKTISYGENHPLVRSTSRDHRDDSLRRHVRHGRHAVREANANSLGCEPCCNVRHGHYSDGDSGGLFALHARRFYTDWRIVRQRHANSSGERESLGRLRAGGNDVKSDCLQRGIGRFVDRSRKLRLRVAVLNVSTIFSFPFASNALLPNL